MICPFCHNEVKDNSLICPYCDNEVGVFAARERCNSISGGWKSTLTGVMRSPVFLVSIVFLAIVCAASAVTVIDAFPHYFSMLCGGIPLIFAVLTLTRMILVYTKKGDLSSGDMRYLTSYLLWKQIGAVFYLVMTSLVSLLFLMIGVVGMAVIQNFDEFAESVAGEVAESKEYLDMAKQIIDKIGDVGSVILLVICVITVAIILFVAINYLLTFSKGRRFYQNVIASADASLGKAPIKAPVKRLYVFGVLIALGGIPSIISPLLVPKLSTLAQSLTQNAAGIRLSLSTLLSGVSAIALGGYLFTTGLLLDKIAGAYNKQLALYGHEIEWLNQLEQATANFRATAKKQSAEEHSEAVPADDRTADTEAQPAVEATVEASVTAEESTAADANTGADVLPDDNSDGGEA